MGQGFRYKAGSGHAEPFKASGKPYLLRGVFPSGSAAEAEQVVNFPSVTKSIMITNEQPNSGSFVLRFSFASRTDPQVYTGSDGTGHSAVLNPGEAVTMDVKARTLYVSTDGAVPAAAYYMVIAELSGIVEAHALSGDGIDE